MNPHKVRSREEVEAELKKLGFEKTDQGTATSTIWRSVQTGRHLQVPLPYEDMYPEFVLRDLRERMKPLGQGSVH